MYENTRVDIYIYTFWRVGNCRLILEQSCGAKERALRKVKDRLEEAGKHRPIWMICVTKSCPEKKVLACSFKPPPCCVHP